MTTTVTAQIDATIEHLDRIDAALTTSTDPEATLRSVRSSTEQLMNWVRIADARHELHRRIWQRRNEATPLPAGAVDAGKWDNGDGVGDDPGRQGMDYREVFYARVVVEGCGEMATFSRIQNADGTLEPLEILIEEFKEVTPDEARQFARELLAAVDRVDTSPNLGEV